jgi:hypothetical protein
MAILIINRNRYGKVPYDDLIQPVGDEPVLFITEYLEGFEGKYEVVEKIDQFRRNGNVELRALELGERYPIRHIIATSEYDLVRAGRLRERFGIPGQSASSAMAFRDKVLMKDIAKEVVDVPRYQRIRSVLDIYDFIRSVGYPVIIKPTDGAGSLNTFVIKGREDLVRYLDRCEAGEYEIEEFIQGQMYTVDGLYAGGRIAISWASRYVNDCLSYQQGKQASMVQLADEHPLRGRLHEFTGRLLKRMPTPEVTTFHAEIFHGVGDRLVLCEVASRTGGGGINELGVHRFGFNIHHAWIKSQCGIRDDILRLEHSKSEELFGFAQIPPRVGKLVEMPTRFPFDWGAEYLPEDVLGKEFKGLSESSDKIATVLVRGATESEVVTRMDQATEWMFENCRWER